MFVNDNYGSRWVRSFQMWLRSKTLEGIDYSQLILSAVLDGSLKKSKAVELVNEYLDLGLVEMRDSKVYWFNKDINPEDSKKVSPIKSDIKKKQKPTRKPNEVMQTPRDLYKIYVNSCKESGETPLDFESWYETLPAETRAEWDDVRKI